MDSANYVTMLLIDKGYFDYDFEKHEGVKEARPTKTQEELENILAGFGFSQFQKKDPENEEELQSYIIKQESYGS